MKILKLALILCFVGGIDYKVGNDSLFLSNAYDAECFGEAAEAAQEIIDACDRALEDLDDEE